MNLNINFEEKLINSKLNYAIISIPLLLITGPFLPDLVLTISSIYFLICAFIYKEFKLFRNKFFKIFLFFYFICILSSLLSEYKIHSLKSSLPYIRFGLFFLLVHFYFIKDKNFLKNLYFVMISSYLILIIDGFYQFFFGNNLFGYPIIHDRVSSFFKDELVLGSYISRFLPLLIGISIYTEIVFKKRYVLLNYFIFFSSIVLTYISGERTAFFFIILICFYYLFFWQRISRSLLLVSLMSLLIIIVITYFNSDIKKRMIDLTADQLSIDNIDKTKPMELYQGHFLIAYDLFKKNPILGVGPKNYRKHCYNDEKYQQIPYYCTTHPHNTYFQLLAETGVIGFFIILIFFISIVFNLSKYFFLFLFKKKKTREDFYLSITLCILISLWPFVPSGSFFNNYMSIIYFYPLGIYFAFNDDTLKT